MFRRIIVYLYALFLIESPLVFSLTLKEKLEQATATPGSFIITEHQNNLSFIRLHSFKESFLFLEEINIPSHLLPKKGIHWEQWLKEKAPHHTSWVLYQIDLNQCKIIDCYSFSRESYISLSGQHSFLATLMTLPLEKVSLSERKKIGPKPPSDMPDTRKLWNPPKNLNGKKHANNHFEMMRARWPKDDSDLSGKMIDLYFDQDQPLFPFPYWIEIGDGYNIFKINVLDSGYSNIFPFKHPPIKSPSIHQLTLLPDKLQITLKDALSFKEFQVIATESSSKTYHSTILPYELLVHSPFTSLNIPRKILSQHLNLDKNLLYTFTITPIECPSLVIEYPKRVRLGPD